MTKELMENKKCFEWKKYFSFGINIDIDMTNFIFYHTYENNPQMITLFFQYKLLIKMFFNFKQFKLIKIIKYLETYKWPSIIQ